jgi:hypothetical protein
MLETLEDRWTPAVTDLTQLAQQLGPPPDQPTHLYLNFDGYQGTYQGETHDVQPFAGSQEDIQDIIYQTSEKFAPFNVQVSRISGAGNYDAGNGSTTIFIGGDQQNLDWNILGPYAHSGLYGTDIPSQFHKDMDGGTDHAPNSNPFDIAWVDPTSKVDGQGNTITDPTQWTNSWDDATIADRIAHEAGHTFGLSHVDSLGIPEMMSYTAQNTRFLNATFQIDTADNNGNSVQSDEYGLRPVWDGTPITTQNSFTFLQAELGARPDDGMAHVADPGSVDPGAFVTPTALTDAPAQGAITRDGDYDVYTYVAGEGHNLITVQATGDDGTQTLNPELLIYDSQGNRVFAGNMVAGQTYSIVVGAVDGVGTGSYQISTLLVPDVPPLVGNVGPEDPVTDPTAGTGNPVVTNPAFQIGDPAMIDPTIAFSLPQAQSATPDTAPITQLTIVQQSTDLSVYQVQTAVPQQQSLNDAGVLGLQSLGQTTYQPLSTGLGQSLTLQPLSLAHVGSYFLL